MLQTTQKVKKNIDTVERGEKKSQISWKVQDSKICDTLG